MKASVGSRVLMLLENNPYPQDGRVRQEATTLVSGGYQVSVICPKRSGQPWHDVHNDVDVYRFPEPPQANGFLGYLWEYSYAMITMFLFSLFVFLRKNFDIVHTHNPPDTLVFIATFYKLLGKRFIYDHHDLVPEMYDVLFENSNELVYQVQVWLEKLSCRLADRIITTNQSYKHIEMQRG
ncbi:MAG: glycosyltransferase family 4 protein, partial [Gammaproteobacteria bacterium]|nr:glycosyltransferase family 4 protein [Gammaproteobacteria bacterium]